MKVKKIFTKKLAYRLVEQGFNLIDMEKNLKKPWLNVFVFEETENLLRQLEQYSIK